MVSWVEGAGGRPFCAFLPPGVTQCLGGGQLTAIDLLESVNSPLLLFLRTAREKNQSLSVINITLDQYCQWASSVFAEGTSSFGSVNI